MANEQDKNIAISNKGHQRMEIENIKLKQIINQHNDKETYNIYLADSI